MGKTTIETFDWVWNPVRGCKRKCVYCYAEKLNKRFFQDVIDREKNFLETNKDKFPNKRVDEESIRQFLPTFIYSNYYQKLPSRSSNIFVSMSDPHYWLDDELRVVIKKINEHPQHNFFFLTKDIGFYRRVDFSPNCYLGVTIDDQHRSCEYIRVLQKTNFKFKNPFWISFEPLLTDVHTSLISMASWVAVGTETGNRKEKVVPDRRWVKRISEECKMYNVPLYMKNSLQRVWGGKLRKEFPEW